MLGGMEKLFGRLARLTRSHDSVISRAELVNIGFSDDRIATMMNKELWQRLHDGVYFLGAGELTWRQRARAAVLACGEGAFLSHESAARWWSLDGAADHDIIHVTVARTSGPRPKNVKVHHPSRQQKTVVRDHVRMTTILETLVDFAADAGRQLVERAVESALLGRRTTERHIWRLIAMNSRHGVRGVALLRHVMLHRPKGKPARSVLELEVLELIRKEGLPVPVRNQDVIDANGDTREIDLCYVLHKGAIEADGQAFHSTATQTENDRLRQAALEAVGYRFVRVTWYDRFHRPEWVIEQIRALLVASVRPEAEQTQQEKSA